MNTLRTAMLLAVMTALFMGVGYLLGGSGGMMIALPLYFQMVFEYSAMQTGIAIAPFSLSIFVVALLAGR